MYAPGEWRNRARKIEAPQHLFASLAKICRPHPITSGYHVLLEQSAISCEQNPPLFRGDRRQLFILSIATIFGVESQRPQIADEPPQVRIRDKTQLAQRLGPAAH